MKQRLLQMVFLGIKQFRDPYYQGFAAQISFYLLLSLVPIFLLLTQILGYFDLSAEDMVRWISEYTGREVSDMLWQLTRFSSAGAGNLVFVFMALWAASRAQFAIMRITNYTFSDGKSTGRGYWRERFRAVRTMTVTLFTIAFALIILGNGNFLLESLGTLSSIAAVMFWFYFLAWVMCLGILVNKVWDDTSGFSKRKPVKRL